MTTSTKLSGAALAPKPPAKGSFPLDHLSECKQFAKAYEKCLDEHKRISQHCRREARAYLQCRMERGLMATEEWSKLGLSKDTLTSDNDVATKASEKDDDGGARAEKEGFVAGVRAAKRRKERYLPKGSADKPD